VIGAGTQDEPLDAAKSDEFSNRWKASMGLGRSTPQCEALACPRRRRSWRAWLETPRGTSLDGHWYCGPECFQQALVSAVEPLLSATAPPPATAHRVPLGLLMLSRGYVGPEQLKQALKAQKDSGTGRVGEWLRHIGAATEEQVTQVLGLQWSMPVYPLHQTRHYLECAHLIPLALLEAVEMVPVHYLAASRHLYMAFVDRVNYTALYSVEKMLDCRTEPCLASQSQMQEALQELRTQPRPAELVVDGSGGPAQIAETTWSYVSRLGGEGVRVAGFTGFLWIRILSLGGSNDLLFRIPQIEIPPPTA